MPVAVPYLMILFDPIINPPGDGRPVLMVRRVGPPMMPFWARKTHARRAHQLTMPGLRGDLRGLGLDNLHAGHWPTPEVLRGK